MESKKKEFPHNYPDDAVDILDAMSFSDGKEVQISGSMSLRSQQYAGDYDAYEIVEMNGSDDEVLHKLRVKFQIIIKRLKAMKDVWIGDIKSGVIPEWEIVGEKFSFPEAEAKMEDLLNKKIITETEYEDAFSYLKPKMSKIDLILARKEIKFHIIRWSVPEVLNGTKKLRDGRSYNLEDAFHSHSLTKLDVIGKVENNRYTDFSMIYEFKNGSKVLNPVFENVSHSLREDILFYTHTGKPFKALKRAFALARNENATDRLKKLTEVLNSDLGRMYALVSDLGTMEDLLEDHKTAPIEAIKFELGQLKGRMANIYASNTFIRKEKGLLKYIASALEGKSREEVRKHMSMLKEELETILAKDTPKDLIGGVLYPIERLVKWDIRSVPTQKKATKEATTIENKLRDLAHYYSWRDPASSLGYRVLADDLFSQIPRIEGNRKIEQNKKHADAQEFVANLIVNPRPELRNFLEEWVEYVEPMMKEVQKENPKVSSKEDLGNLLAKKASIVPRM